MAGVEQPPVELSTRRVLEAVARHLGVGVGDILGRERAPDAVAARWVAMTMLRSRGLSYRQLGTEMRRRHVTVIRTLRYARALPRARDLVEHVERMMAQEAARTRRAIVDVEAEFRRAREDAGAPPAKLPGGTTR